MLEVHRYTIVPFDTERCWWHICCIVQDVPSALQMHIATTLTAATTIVDADEAITEMDTWDRSPTSNWCVCSKPTTETKKNVYLTLGRVVFLQH